MNDLFVDRLGNVSLGNGVARLDFLRLESIDQEKQQVTMKPSVRVVIPLEGLLQTLQMLESLRDQLIKDGQLTRTPADNAQAAPGRAVAAEAALEVKPKN